MFRRAFIVLTLIVSFPALLYAGLEVPAPNSFVSGSGFISGWKCNAGILTFTTDDGPTQSLASGISRPDAGCGNSGFLAEFNWNLLSNGPHTIRVFNNGAQFEQVTFMVTPRGTEFLWY